MSQRLSESAVKGSLRWFTEDERDGMKSRGHGRLGVPMGIRPDGRFIFPIAGASPDDPSNDEGGTGGSGDGGGEGGSEGQGDKGDGGSGEGADGNKDGKGESISKAEYDKLMARMQAADRSKSEVEKKLKELEEKDLSEQEKALKLVPELQESVATLQKENQGLKAKVAFLGLDGFSWHDPDVALAQVDLSEVVGEDGTINKKELKKAAEVLAKDKAFLVKAATDDKDKGKNGAGGNGQGSSGSGVGSGGRGAGNNGVDEAALKAKYPALNV